MSEVFFSEEDRVQNDFVEVRFLGRIKDPSGVFGVMVVDQFYKFRPTAMVLRRHLPALKERKIPLMLEADYQARYGQTGRPAEPEAKVEQLIPEGTGRRRRGELAADAS